MEISYKNKNRQKLKFLSFLLVFFRCNFVVMMKAKIKKIRILTEIITLFVK
jgi:hypothetical protein